jgi:alpha-glucosidase (family GH31 glycosyl hydrolase)
MSSAADPSVLSIGDEFMWGDSILVAPIVNVDDNAIKSRAVYLPKYAGWVDFW